MTSASPQGGDRVPPAEPSRQHGRRQDVMTAATLTPAFIRARMATAGCYGDGITAPRRAVRARARGVRGGAGPLGR